MIQYVVTVYAVTMRTRISIYRRRFMSKFDELHKKTMPQSAKAPEFGYPDTGNGYYSKRLPYPEWFKMGNAQRCQINFLEHLNYVILAPLLISLSHTTAALVVAVMIFFGRFIFTVSYYTGGPSARLPGALIMDAGIFIGFGYLVSSCLAFAR